METTIIIWLCTLLAAVILTIAITRFWLLHHHVSRDLYQQHEKEKQTLQIIMEVLASEKAQQQQQASDYKAKLTSKWLEPGKRSSPAQRRT